MLLFSDLHALVVKCDVSIEVTDCWFAEVKTIVKARLHEECCATVMKTRLMRVFHKTSLLLKLFIPDQRYTL